MAVKVSIVIPIYNVEKYLRECLDSAINQTLKEIEIICVNDGSTDNCLHIIQEYAKKDNRIIVIDKPNAGYGHTMNVGFNKASGEYIGILESDDYVVAQMYEELYNVAKKYNLDIVKADHNKFIDDGSDRIFSLLKIATEDKNYNKIFNPKENKEIFDFDMHTWSGIYRTDYIKKYNINHNESLGASYQDQGFFLKSFIHANTIMFINKPYYMLRRDNPNSSIYNKGKVYAICDEYQYIRNYIKQFPELENLFKGEIYSRMFGIYIWNFRRIADEFKEEFLTKLRLDFIDALENDCITSDLFRPSVWERILWITSDPESPHRIVRHYKQESKQLVNVINQYDGYYIYMNEKESIEVYESLIDFNVDHKMLGFIDDSFDKNNREILNKPVMKYDICDKQGNLLFIISAYYLKPKDKLKQDNQEYVVVM